MINLFRPCFIRCFHMSMRSPVVRRILSLHVPVAFTFRDPCSFGTSICYVISSSRLCLMRFVFLRAEFCRQLPSDSTSRWTPLLLANGWQLQASIVDFHHLVIHHARHTYRKASFLRCLLCITVFRKCHSTVL
jgi:hypothetical protein